MQNSDGTATCDRCGIGLPGYGVIHGATISDLSVDDNIVGLIVCYNCWPAVITDMVTHGDALACNNCGTPQGFRSVVLAALVTDLAPAEDHDARYLMFCRANGCRNRLLIHITGGP